MRVLATNDVLEQWDKVLVFRDPARRGLDGLDVTIAAQFHPLVPDLLIILTVEELAVAALEEVVDAEDLWQPLGSLGKIDVDLQVLAQRDRQEVQVGHRVVLTHAGLANGRCCRFGFDRSAKGDNAMSPVDGFLYWDPGIRIATAIDIGADLDTIRIVRVLVQVLKHAQAQREAGICVRSGHGLAILVDLARGPLALEVDAGLGDGCVLALPVYPAVIRPEDVAEDDLMTGCMKCLPLDRIILAVDAQDDAKHAVLAIDCTHDTIELAEIGDVVAHDARSVQHGIPGLATH